MSDQPAAAGEPGSPPVAPTWQAPAPVMPFRSAGTRAKMVMGCLAAVVAASVVTILVDLVGLSLMDSIEAGTATTADVESWDALNGTVTLIYLGTYIASAFAYVVWLSRGVENAPSLGAGMPPRSPRGAIGWWFVPIANLWIPYTIVRDLHARLGAPGAPMQRGLLRSWWIMWLLINVVGNVVGRLWVAADTVDSLRSVMAIDLVSYGLDAIAATLALLVVRSIQAREDARAQALIRPSELLEGSVATT